MKNLFLDNNVLIDLLTAREPFTESAIRLFDAAREKDVQLFVAALSISNTYYIIRHLLGHQTAVASILNLLDYLTVLPTDIQVIRKAAAIETTDFEDAIQYTTAISMQDIEAIVTRDIKGFKKSALPVLTPAEALALISG